MKCELVSCVILLKSLFLISQNSISSDLQFLMALEFDRSEDPTYESVSKQSLGYRMQSNFLINHNFEYGRNNGYLTLWNWNGAEGVHDAPDRLNGDLLFKDSENETFSNALDIQDGSGYTLMIKLKSGESFENYCVGDRHLFWIKAPSGQIIYGLKRFNHKLIFYRYTRDPSVDTISGTWKFDLWDPTQFFIKQMSNYTIFISVSKNLFRVYQKASVHGDVYETTTKELVYLGGQEVRDSEILSVGFGSPESSSRLPAVYQIDYFRVLDGYFNFDDLEQIYIDTENIDFESFSEASKMPSKISNEKGTNENIYDQVVFPNPYDGSKPLFAAVQIDEPGRVLIEIQDLLGTFLHSQIVDLEKGTLSKQVPIMTSNRLKIGVYIVKIIEKNRATSHKIIVQ